MSAKHLLRLALMSCITFPLLAMGGEQTKGTFMTAKALEGLCKDPDQKSVNMCIGYLWGIIDVLGFMHQIGPLEDKNYPYCLPKFGTQPFDKTLLTFRDAVNKKYAENRVQKQSHPEWAEDYQAMLELVVVLKETFPCGGDTKP